LSKRKKAPGAPKTRRVFVGIPTYTGKLTKQTFHTLSLFKLEAQSMGWDIQVEIWPGDALIAHARNALVGKFMQTDCTDLMFLDADVGAGPGVFTRLMTHRANLVAGVYPAKTEDERYIVRWLPGKEHKTDPDNDLLEAECVPFGLVRIWRAGIEAIVEAHKDEWFISHMVPGLKCWNLFNTEVLDNVFWGEDFTFCRKWREAGGKVWIDWDLPLIHVNSDGRIFRGHLGNFLKARK
jgi:hypothetical protein